MTTVTDSTEIEQRVPKNGRWGKILLAIILSSFMTASIVLAVIFLLIPHVIKPAIAYREAMALVYDGNYSKAVTSFEKLGNFADSKKKIEFCINVILEDRYNAAVGLFESSDYPKAIAAFHELGDFKDSAAKAAEIEKLPHRLYLIRNKITLLVGDSVNLGVAISPATAENTSVTWTSADESIVYVDEEGSLYAVNLGFTEITASTFNGKTDTCIVEVYDFTSVRVSTVKELMEAIAHYRRIILAPGTYDLSELPVIENKFVQRNREHIGYSYHINGVNGLQIVGETNEDISIVTKHLYADVLSFKNCEGIVLSNLSFGHVDPAQEYHCEGGVLVFDSCSDILVNNCDLYGCGSTGINAYNVNGLSVAFTGIHHCTFHAVSVHNSVNVDLNYVMIYNNQLLSHMFNFENSEGIYILDSLVIDNECSDSLISLTRTDAVFIRCDFYNNKMKSAIKKTIRSSESKAYFYECTIEDNVGDTFSDDPNAVYTDCVIENNRLR